MRIVKKLIHVGNAYAANSTWKDFAVVKFCLCAMGVAIGVQIPKKYKKEATLTAAGVFLVTDIPLLAKTLRIAGKVWQEDEE